MSARSLAPSAIAHGALWRPFTASSACNRGHLASPNLLVDVRRAHHAAGRSAQMPEECPALIRTWFATRGAGNETPQGLPLGSPYSGHWVPRGGIEPPT